MAICDYCSGSGRDAVTAKGTCWKCLGSGTMPDTPDEGRPPVRGDNSGCALLLFGLLLIFLAVTVLVGYIASSELFWLHWADTHWRGTNWWQIGAYILGSSALVAFTARFWGSVIAGLVGIIPAMPMFMATRGRVNIWYIVRGDEFVSPVFTAWVSALGIVALNAYIAHKLQLLSGAPGLLPRPAWLKSRTGILASIVMSVVIVVLYTMIKRANDAW